MHVLIVDDNQINLSLFSHLLKSIPDVVPIEMSEPLLALDWCRKNEPHLVLIDYKMPNLDGLQFLNLFRALPGRAAVPVIMITADIEPDVKHRALQSTANDFLIKPVDGTELLARATNMLTLRNAQLRLINHANQMAVEIKTAAAKEEARDLESLLRLARAAEHRDPETGAHLARLSHYSALLARNLGLSVVEQNLLRDAAPMHDIGKVGIPDRILLKPGRLDDEEMAIMRTHAQIGADILKESNSPLMRAAAAIALSHHEKFDGSGYPNGLKADQIPLYGRIIAVADVFDALTSARAYKPAWEMSLAVATIREGAGAHFDPVCVNAFFLDLDAVLHIHEQYQDEVFL
tara:strand:- start:557534 stop:558577 length:1044 start_codon:yes stop_codon:yes gene_type:complete